MSNTKIKLKRSLISGEVPAVGTLQLGELAINITDKKVWVGTGGESDAPILLVDYYNMEGGGGGGGDFTYSINPPANPSHGDTWFKSTTGQYFVYIASENTNDLVNSWVEITLSGQVQPPEPDPITLDSLSDVQITSDTNNENDILMYIGGIWKNIPGAVYDLQEFTSNGTWTKPENAKIVFVEGTGGGQAGGNGTTGGTGGTGGSAGCAYSLVIPASLLNSTQAVTIGTGGTANQAEGNDTTFAGSVWAGGRGSASARNIFLGAVSAGGFGSGAAANSAGKHGNFGSGGGGGGGNSSSGSAGGKPRSGAFLSGANTPALGGGASGGTLGGPGSSASILNDVYGYGEGGGGGSGIGSGIAGNGGSGRRGSGGGGGGGTTGGGTAGLGGAGGNGFLRIITISWP